MSYLRYNVFMFSCVWWCPTYGGFFWGGGFRLVCPVLPDSLDCPFCIAPSEFSNNYLIQKDEIFIKFVGLNRSE